MKLKPKVSVIIPCYNYGHFVREAVDSIFNQTYQDFELIVVDDGSSDKETIRVLKQLEKEKPDIIIIYQKNTGLPGARNAGIRIAKGEYIVCLDADDLLRPDYLEKTINHFDSNKERKLGIVTTWVQSFGNSDEVWETSNFDVVRLLQMNIIHVSSVFKKKAWEDAGGYKMNMVGGYEDWDFWVGIVEKNWEWALIKEPLFLYRKHGVSMITSSAKIHDELYARIVDNHPNIYQKHYKEVMVGLMNSIFEKDREIVAIQRTVRDGYVLKAAEKMKVVIKDPKKLLVPGNYYKFTKKIYKKALNIKKQNN